MLVGDKAALGGAAIVKGTWAEHRGFIWRRGSCRCPQEKGLEQDTSMHRRSWPPAVPVGKDT